MSNYSTLSMAHVTHGHATGTQSVMLSTQSNAIIPSTCMYPIVPPNTSALTFEQFHGMFQTYPIAPGSSTLPFVHSIDDNATGTQTVNHVEMSQPANRTNKRRASDYLVEPTENSVRPYQINDIMSSTQPNDAHDTCTSTVSSACHVCCHANCNQSFRKDDNPYKKRALRAHYDVPTFGRPPESIEDSESVQSYANVNSSSNLTMIHSTEDHATDTQPLDLSVSEPSQKPPPKRWLSVYIAEMEEQENAIGPASTTSSMTTNTCGYASGTQPGNKDEIIQKMQRALNMRKPLNPIEATQTSGRPSTEIEDMLTTQANAIDQASSTLPIAHNAAGNAPGTESVNQHRVKPKRSYTRRAPLKPAEPKKPRGRPLKSPNDENASIETNGNFPFSTHGVEIPQKPKRTYNRRQKIDPLLPKRPRGRPRKIIKDPLSLTPPSSPTYVMDSNVTSTTRSDPNQPNESNTSL